MILAIAFQLAVARPGMSPKDSAKLVNELRDAEYLYLTGWRGIWEQVQADQANYRQQLALDAAHGKGPPPPIVPQASAPPPPKPVGPVKEQPPLDIDVNVGIHFVPAVNPRLSYRPTWVSLTPQMRDEQFGIDTPFPDDAKGDARKLRAKMIARLDVAARSLPGDRWIAGQRVRLDLEQADTAGAMKAANGCAAVRWSCQLLRGYVRWIARDADRAGPAFDSALATMPPDSACVWSDVTDLLGYSGRQAYERMSCAERAAVNRTMWWLADPLFIIPGNERRTEQFARRVMAALDMANDVDEREDIRDAFAGESWQSLLLRYGWPSTELWGPPRRCMPPLPLAHAPQPPPICEYFKGPGASRFDIHGVYLGLTYEVAGDAGNRWFTDTSDDPPAVQMDQFSFNPNPPQPLYAGPRYHTAPSWNAIVSPFASTPDDWDVGPNWHSATVWDRGWWQQEFYARREGPLVDLETQVAFVRRPTSAVAVAAVQWGAMAGPLPPPRAAVFGLVTTTGPDSFPNGTVIHTDGAHPAPIMLPVVSRPVVLGLEMVPENIRGAAGRVRFGVTPPAPLSALAPQQLAVSDPILLRTLDGVLPSSVEQASTQMFGTTLLRDPKRVALFWEVYGQNDHDTVDVTIRIRHPDNAGVLRSLAAAIGIGHAGEDTLEIKWREPRPNDPHAITDSGFTIRPRGEVIDMSSLAPGTYVLEVSTVRPFAAPGSASAIPAVSRRVFSVWRP